MKAPNIAAIILATMTIVAVILLVDNSPDISTSGLLTPEWESAQDTQHTPPTPASLDHNKQDNDPLKSQAPAESSRMEIKEVEKQPRLQSRRRKDGQNDQEYVDKVNLLMKGSLEEIVKSDFLKDLVPGNVSSLNRSVVRKIDNLLLAHRREFKRLSLIRAQSLVEAAHRKLEWGLPLRIPSGYGNDYRVVHTLWNGQGYTVDISRDESPEVFATIDVLRAWPDLVKNEIRGLFVK